MLTSPPWPGRPVLSLLLRGSTVASSLRCHDLLSYKRTDGRGTCRETNITTGSWQSTTFACKENTHLAPLMSDCAYGIHKKLVTDSS